MTSVAEGLAQNSEEENLQRVKNSIESLLFLSDRPVEVRQLQKILEVEPKVLETAINSLEEECRARGVRIQRKGHAVQMVTSPEAASVVEKFLGMESGAKLSTAALETLAITAYQQPITRARIEALRGVNSDRAVATLQARGLIAEVGRLEGPGRPVLFATTFEFLQHFGLQKLEDLPPLPAHVVPGLEVDEG